MVRHRPASEDWQILFSQALLASGKYPEAYTAITNALEENSWSVRLEWQSSGSLPGQRPNGGCR